MNLEIQRQLQAAYASLTAAQIAIETALSAAVEPLAAPVEELVTPRCSHSNRQSASTFNTPARDYCKDCQSFVYPDGRIEPVEG